MSSPEKKETGTLYAIGVGPGDPELLTIKGQRLLRQIGLVFSAASKADKESLALKIAGPFLKRDAEIIPLIFPMVRDKKVLEKAWFQAAETILSHLKRGKDAAFVTLGDPSTYSTFTYLHRTIVSMDPETNIEIVPGITSFQAAAACLKIPLSEGEESLAVVSGAKGAREIKEVAPHVDNLIIMKAYRHYHEIVKCLDECGLLESSMAVRRVGLDDESVTTKLREWNGHKPSYFTLLLSKKDKKEKKLHNS